MRRDWVVLLEVACDSGPELELETVEALLAKLADRYPSALYAPDRCAIQFLVREDGPDGGLAAGVALWREAAREVAFPDGDLVRAEVKTPAELVAEYEHADDPSPSLHAPADEDALAAAYESTRRLLRVGTPREAVSVLTALVRRLGGTALSPRPSDPRTMDLDLSLGEGDPMVPAAEPFSVSRLCLEEVLPAAVDDARRIVVLLRAASSSGGVALADFDHP
jgi:hypothetical protein